MWVTLLYQFLCLEIYLNLLGENRRNTGFCSRNLSTRPLQINYILFRKYLFLIWFISAVLVQRSIGIQRYPHLWSGSWGLCLYLLCPDTGTWAVDQAVLTVRAWMKLSMAQIYLDQPGTTFLKHSHRYFFFNLMEVFIQPSWQLCTTYMVGSDVVSFPLS